MPDGQVPPPRRDSQSRRAPAERPPWLRLALLALVPRRVWLVGGRSSVPGPRWSVDSPTDPDSWRATLERHQVGYLLLLEGASLSGLRATGFDRIAWSEGYSSATLVAVAAAR